MAILENSFAVSYKTNMHLPFDPATMLPGVYPKELKICVHTKTYTQMFIQ